MQLGMIYGEEKNGLRNIEPEITKMFRKLLVCLSVHNMKFEAELEIYISVHHIFINQKMWVMYHFLYISLLLLEVSFVEFIGRKIHGIGQLIVDQKMHRNETHSKNQSHGMKGSKSGIQDLESGHRRGIMKFKLPLVIGFQRIDKLSPLLILRCY